MFFPPAACRAQSKQEVRNKTRAPLATDPLFSIVRGTYFVRLSLTASRNFLTIPNSLLQFTQVPAILAILIQQWGTHLNHLHRSYSYRIFVYVIMVYSRPNVPRRSTWNLSAQVEILASAFSTLLVQNNIDSHAHPPVGQAHTCISFYKPRHTMATDFVNTMRER